jgi:hypothetical protein
MLPTGRSPRAGQVKATAKLPTIGPNIEGPINAAGKQASGRTGHKTTDKQQKFAKGGNPRPAGGLSRPAGAGRAGNRRDTR